MTEARKWYDVRNFDDAPVWMGAEESAAWAAGYNAAVRQYEAELNETFRQETQT